MATKRADGQHIIAAGEVGAFSVCPMSWKLKWIDKARPEGNRSVILGQELHQKWAGVFDEAVMLGRWIRYLAVLIITAAVVFILIHPADLPLSQIFVVSVKSHGLQLILLAALTLLVIRSFLKASRKRRRDSGFSAHEVAVAIEGSTLVPAREYISITQGLAGKPDALIREGDDIIPVERKPLAKKLRDRYVAQLLVYMRLIEEFEGKRPSKGYLLLGKECRRIIVHNTEAKQRWVTTLVMEMRRILDGGDAKPAPHRAKCAKCDVRELCSARQD